MAATMWLKKLLFSKICKDEPYTDKNNYQPKCHSCKDKLAIKKKLSGFYVLELMHTLYFDVVTAIQVK